MPTPVEVTLLTRPGCHLCDDARAIVLTAAAEFPSVAVTETSIVDEPELLARYAEEIPVVLIDGRVHNIWHIDPARLRAALTEATR